MDGGSGSGTGTQVRKTEITEQYSNSSDSAMYVGSVNMVNTFTIDWHGKQKHYKSSSMLRKSKKEVIIYPPCVLLIIKKNQTLLLAEPKTKKKKKSKTIIEEYEEGPEIATTLPKN